MNRRAVTQSHTEKTQRFTEKDEKRLFSISLPFCVFSVHLCVGLSEEKVQ